MRERFKEKLFTISNFFENTTVFMAVRQGLIMMIPLILSGSISLMLMSLPIAAYQNILPGILNGKLLEVLEFIYAGTFKVFSVPMTVATSVSYTMINHNNKLEREVISDCFIVSIINLITFMGYIGVKITLKSRDDLFNINKLSRLSSNIGKDKSSKKDHGGKSIPPKVLDTSVIIDGRIADICRTGFVEGKLIIPKFVLNELQHIADSSDDLKRVRGRRGLDILNIIQKELDIEVEITEKDFDDIPEVDSKLLKLAQVMNGKVVTNDYNLNKVAQFQGVEVLNINQLANAVKPVAIPGEEMVAQVVKEGKESNQGIAYLDDGTMIVVEGGKKHIGETINVLVTSVLQTSAGRMIFGKPKN